MSAVPVILAPDDRDSIDSAEIVRRLLARRWLILGCVLFFSATFAGAAFYMTPIYRSTTILAPATGAQAGGAMGALGQLGGIASLAGINLSPHGSNTDEALAVLRSRDFTERFIAENNLMLRLFAKRWDANLGHWKGEAPTPDKAYRYFNQKVRSVDQDKKTGLVTLQIDWRDRDEAAKWANELVKRLNQEMRNRAIAEAAASLGYLTNELQSSNEVVTREAIGHLMESQIKQRMMANVTLEYVFRVVDPAMPADADDPVKPQKLVMIAAGLFIGIVVAVLWVLVSGDPGRRSAAAIPQPGR